MSFKYTSMLDVVDCTESAERGKLAGQKNATLAATAARKPSLRGEWRLEILCSICSFFCFFCQSIAPVVPGPSCLAADSRPVIILILRTFDQRTIPQLPLAISLNTVLALLTTVAKGCFIVPVVECLGQWKWNWFRRPRALDSFSSFDESSRGVWGSLSLMWRLRFQY